MPVFMDSHDGTTMPDALRQTISGRVRSGAKDDFGVVDRGIVIDRDDGKMHCILEAPDESAVIRHHESLEVPLDPHTIHQAEVILR